MDIDEENAKTIYLKYFLQFYNDFKDIRGKIILLSRPYLFCIEELWVQAQ